MAAVSKPKHRLIVRLGLLLVSHSFLVSVLCSVAGFVALLILPILAKNTYVSENALMPGSANPTYSSQDVVEATSFIKEITGSINTNEGARMEVQKLIQQHVADVGAEFYYHKLWPRANHFSPIHFFSSAPNNANIQNNTSCTSFSLNSVAIVRAPRGDGKEAIVLVTPFNSNNMKLSDAVTLGLGFSIFSLLSRVTWLAKDIIWIAADSRFGEYAAIDGWLKDYYDPFLGNSLDKEDIGLCKNIHHDLDNVLGKQNSNTFRRAGTMAASLVLKVTEKQVKEDRDILTLSAEASNGQMPNLDLLNIVHYLAVHRQGLRVKIGAFSSLLNSSWLSFIGKLLQRLGELVRLVDPKWKFDISSYDYVEGTATLASSMLNQALGVPTGSHGAFRDYQVDAITLDFSSRLSLHNEKVQSAFLLRAGRLIEGVTRSVNNLLEKFHQSFFLYFLTAPNKFVSVGVYMIPFALLLVPLPIVAAALFSSSSNRGTADSASDILENSAVSWKWLQALWEVFVIHLWSVIVAVLPLQISQYSSTSTTCMLLWTLLSSCTLFLILMIAGSSYAYVDWRLLKSVMIATVSVGLSLMSIVNFSAAQIGAILLVPLCLLVQPIRSQAQLTLLKKVMLIACNLVLTVGAFPPTALMIVKGLLGGFDLVDVGDFWEWAELLWSWNSASYLYILLVHLPCWVVCVRILFYPGNVRS